MHPPSAGAFQFLGSTALGGSMTHWQGGSRTRCEQKRARKLKYTRLARFY